MGHFTLCVILLYFSAKVTVHQKFSLGHDLKQSLKVDVAFSTSLDPIYTVTYYVRFVVCTFIIEQHKKESNILKKVIWTNHEKVSISYMRKKRWVARKIINKNYTAREQGTFGEYISKFSQLSK